MKRFKRSFIVVGLVLIMTMIAATLVISHPTYSYYDDVLSKDQFLKLVDVGTPLHCAPLTNAGISLDMICFNTQQETEAYLNPK
ncbi:MAG: hypothetical protein ABI690_04545 [Chloroflexota bacterium]